MSAFIDITGQRFGKLVVIQHLGCRGKNTVFLCRCDCGSSKEVVGKELRRGRTKSCGCLRASIWTGLTKSPLYGVWNNIVQRCENANNPQYHHYGGRGIYLDSRWREPAPFIEWAMGKGYRKGLEIDRIDNDGPYSPDNCRLVTRKANTRNTRKSRIFPWKGRLATIAEISEETSIHYSTLHHRLTVMGLSSDEALLPQPKGPR